MNSTEKEERLKLLKHVHALRSAQRHQSTSDGSTHIILPQQLKQNEMQNEKSDTMQTPKLEKEIAKENYSGLQITMSDSEDNGTPGTSEQNLPTVKANSLQESNTGRSTDLKEHLKNLREASSQSMNLLDSTTEHLHGLMKGLGKNSEEANPMKADPYRNQMVINQTVNVANQLHKAMKLKLDTVKVLHKISTDIGD